MVGMGRFQTTLLVLTFPFVSSTVTSLLMVKKQSANISQLTSYAGGTFSAVSMVTCAAKCAETASVRCKSVLYDRDSGECTVYSALWTGAGEADTRWRYYAITGTLADLGGEWTEFYTPYGERAVDYQAVNLTAKGITVAGKTSVVFKVKANNDVHVLLRKDETNYIDNVIEIVIGGFGNAMSVVRNAQQGTNMASYSESGLVSGTEFRYFWVSYGDGVIAVGKGDMAGVSPFISWTMSPIHAVNYIAVGTGYGSDGYWAFWADV